jgi:hypothetical protein
MVIPDPDLDFLPIPDPQHWAAVTVLNIPEHVMGSVAVDVSVPCWLW